MEASLREEWAANWAEEISRESAHQSRDGVSEDQYGQVLKRGLKPMCAQLYDQVGRSHPKITLIVVGKRHHTRFFPTKPDDADDLSDPMHGTNRRPNCH